MPFKKFYSIFFIVLNLYILTGCNKDGITESNLDNYRRCSGPAFSPDGLKIAYTKTIQEPSCKNGEKTISEIYVAGIDGRNKRQLTFLGVKNFRPIYCPAGNYIFFHVSMEEKNAIYRMDTDGSNQMNLSNNGSEDNIIYDISNNGSKILFYSRRDTAGDLFIMDDEGKNLIQVTNNVEFEESAEFSPDDSKVLFCLGDKIYIVDVNGADIKNLMKEDERGCYPCFSPDGSKIAYASFDGSWEIFIMTNKGENKTNLTHNESSDFDPVFSPDGNKIMFTSNRDGNTEIYVMNINGNEQRRLTYNEGYDEFPIFSPNGLKIAYDCEDNGRWDIYIMNVNGTQKKNLTLEYLYNFW